VCRVHAAAQLGVQGGRVAGLYIVCECVCCREASAGRAGSKVLGCARAAPKLGVQGRRAVQLLHAPSWTGCVVTSVLPSVARPRITAQGLRAGGTALCAESAWSGFPSPHRLLHSMESMAGGPCDHPPSPSVLIIAIHQSQFFITSHHPSSSASSLS